jgi:hypothetical protein
MNSNERVPRRFMRRIFALNSSRLNWVAISAKLKS